MQTTPQKQETNPPTNPTGDDSEQPGAAPESNPELEPAPEAGQPVSMEELFSAESLTRYSEQVREWFITNVMSWEMGLQIVLVFGAIIPAVIFSPAIRQFCTQFIENKLDHGLMRRLANAATRLAMPIALLLFLIITSWVLQAFGLRTEFIHLVRALLTAWVAIRAITLAIRSNFWSKVAFFIVWPIAALDAFGLLDDLTRWMDSTRFTLSKGDPAAGIPASQISLLDTVRTLIIFLVIYAVMKLVSGFLAKYINKSPDLSPSLKTMLVKFINIIAPVLALMMALQVVNFNLASLAIFGGAIGIGIGFGLQSIVANFMAGLTLLFDKSIKPGDSIEIGDTYGWVTAMNTRYVAVRTRDGDDHLVPNDNFINNGVINRSHGDPNYRIHAPIGVSYSTKDMELVQRLCIEACNEVDRVLKTPPPACLMIEYGDNSVNFDIRFWINDVPNGIANVRSKVLMNVWKNLQENNIEIPFPQRDLHIHGGAIPVRTVVDQQDD